MSKVWKSITCSLGIVVGILIVVVGIVVHSWSSFEIYGGDFYTDIYRSVNDIIDAIGWLLISLGAIDICYFFSKFVPMEVVYKKLDEETTDSDDAVVD